MIKQLSFTRYEHKILPNFRQMISKAESTEDMKKFFVYTASQAYTAHTVTGSSCFLFGGLMHDGILSDSY